MASSSTTVPAALHAELTEYTNLIRVLRTNRTLDLTTHLLHHAQQHQPDTDTWTSWPLIDCPVPEWSFEDEIQHLADVVLQQRARAERASTDHGTPDSDADSDRQGLSPTSMKRLVFHSGAFLAHMLNLMADQRPSAPGSMQNRLWPMNWEDVISLLAVGGVLDPSVVSRAEQRLERIYGPSDTKAMERVASVTSAKARFAGLASVWEDELLAPPVLHPRVGRKVVPGRQSHPSKIKSCAIIDTSTDDDA